MNYYEKDFNLWLQTQATALKNKDIKNMDWNNLIEEIEDMGKSEKRSLESYLERLIEHILKIKYWESQKSFNLKHWQVEIKNFRKRIIRLLERSPSLNNYAIDIYPRLFNEAVDTWQIQFHIPETAFFDFDYALNKDVTLIN